MSDIYKDPSELTPEIDPEIEFFCPVSDCQNEMLSTHLEDFQCSECETGFVLKIVDGVSIPSVRRRGLDGFMEVVDMPELPSKREDRFVTEHGLQREQASKLTTKMAIADFYEKLANETSTEVAATFVADTLVGELHYRNMNIESINYEDVVDLVTDIDSDVITRKSAVDVVRESLDSDENIDSVYADKDLQKVGSDDLAQIVREVVSSEDEAVNDYHEGESGAVNYLVGEVMSETGGQADAEQARDLILSELE